ncbi:CAP domain-containing protein [Fictibacillus iocasae]|uniref:CAP domain-containing protein n=1 Tax=Fictibacillus iocasae TaxID=2715437 RepID=A0ABW2NRU8_9BACL
MVRILLILMLSAVIFYLLYLKDAPNKPFTLQDKEVSPAIQKQEKLVIPRESAVSYLGRTEKEWVKKWGKPDRVESSAYGYEWYVYAKDRTAYIQAGVKDGKVVTVYALGDRVNVEPFKIGESSESVLKKASPKSSVNVDDQNGLYRFELSETDLNIRPLIAINEDVYAQLYMDQYTQKLSSVRYIAKSVLISQQPYSVVFQGKAPEQPKLTPKEQQLVEEANEKQVLDMTNVIRERHGLRALILHRGASEVAYLHSKDMAENEYFSHTSPTTGELSDRLMKGNVEYRAAGENIAANYTDGAAAVEGWLNSEGHRRAMLNKDYTHLGVGVYKKHYTQNFVTP